MANKFKVGDRVITHKVGSVSNANGKIGTIENIFFKDCRVKYDHEIRNDHGMQSSSWFVNFENMELIPQPSIHIYPNKNNTSETIAVLKQGKEIIKTAKATCNPADEYDFNKGADIAINRLLRITDRPKEVREVKRKAEAGEYVKIVKDDISSGRCYQKGDIGKYIEDGVCTATGGFVTTRGTHPCNKGPETSFLYEKEYIVLENYTPTETTKADLSHISDVELLDEIAKRMGGTK